MQPSGRGGKRPRSRRKAGASLEDRLVDRYLEAGTLALQDDRPERLDPTIRREMETLTGADLSDVRVHTGSGARRMAQVLGARAFALEGGDVFLPREHFDPASSEGKALLAHELTHVAEGQSGLSRVPRRPVREEMEQRARRAEEFVLAQEDAQRTPPATEEAVDPERVRLPGQGEEAGSAEGRVVLVDKDALEQKVWDRLERETRRHRDRLGS
ncbi:DUF4157 domain-containing protein [Myxococcota bacterium]|nr:DUF4157 domain-containing protein [Myxococcota bacterium]